MCIQEHYFLYYFLPYYRSNNFHFEIRNLCIQKNIINICHSDQKILKRKRNFHLIYQKILRKQNMKKVQNKFNKGIHILSILHLNHNIRYRIHIYCQICLSFLGNQYIHHIQYKLSIKISTIHIFPNYHETHLYKRKQILLYFIPQNKTNKNLHLRKFDIHFYIFNKQNFDLQKIHHYKYIFLHVYYLLLDMNHIFLVQNKHDIKVCIQHIKILHLNNSLKHSYINPPTLIHFYRLYIYLLPCMFCTIMGILNIYHYQLQNINLIYMHKDHSLIFFLNLQHILNMNFNFNILYNLLDI